MKYINHISGLEFNKFRIEKGLSQSQLAVILGVSVVTLKSWERERRNIPTSINKFVRLSLYMVSGDRLSAIASKLSASPQL